MAARENRVGLEAIPMRLLEHRRVIMQASTISAIFGSVLVFFPMRVIETTKRFSVCTNLAGVSRVLGTCLMFMIVGPALMMLNKDIMQSLGFHYPMSLSLMGLMSSAVGARLVVWLGFATVRSESLEVVSGSKWYGTALPVGACRALTLATGNAVYLHLGLGFIQMLKAFTPVMVLVVMRIAGVAKPSRIAVAFVFIIVFGTMLEVKGELSATPFGLFLLFASEFCEALSIVLTQRLLQNENFTVIETMYSLAPPGAFLLLLAAMICEWPRMIDQEHYAIILQRPAWFLSAAALGVAVNFVGYMVVQATSSLTCKILNIARCTGLVFVGVLVYGETIMPLELLGYCVALFGVLGYNFAQMLPKSASELEQSLEESCCVNAWKRIQ